MRSKHKGGHGRRYVYGRNERKARNWGLREKRRLSGSRCIRCWMSRRIMLVWWMRRKGRWFGGGSMMLVNGSSHETSILNMVVICLFKHSSMYRLWVQLPLSGHLFDVLFFDNNSISKHNMKWVRPSHGRMHQNYHNTNSVAYVGFSWWRSAAVFHCKYVQTPYTIIKFRRMQPYFTAITAYWQHTQKF